MIKKKIKPIFNDGWCFAVVNGRLAEIHFKRGLGIWAHSYVKRSEFNKREKRMIDVDIKKCRFTYRNKSYFDKDLKIWQKAPGIKKIFPDIKKSRKLKRLEDLL